MRLKIISPQSPWVFTSPSGFGQALGFRGHTQAHLLQGTDFDHAFPVGGLDALLELHQALAQGIQQALELLVRLGGEAGSLGFQDLLGQV